VNANRLDLYGPIHKALRAFMSDTLVAVGKMDADDAAEREATLSQLRRLIGALEHHGETEDRFVHPAMESRRPGSARQRGDEHRRQRLQLASLARLAEAIERDGTDAPGPAGVPAAEARGKRGNDGQRAMQAATLYRELALLVAENLEHMNEEETLHNAVLWAEFSDGELAAIHDRILASIEPPAMAEVIRWMAPALTPAERAMLFGGLQQQAPPEVFNRLLDIARPHLAPRDWNKLVDRLAAMPQLV